jgi:hypothetical protein
MVVLVVSCQDVLMSAQSRFFSYNLTEESVSPVTIVEYKSSIGSYSCMYGRKVGV